MKTLLLSALLLAPLAAEELPPHLELQTSANAFLASLDDEKRAKATIPFDDEERENWHYVPMDRAGLALKDMNDVQREAATALGKAILSEEGMLKTTQIIRLESILAVLENNPDFRDSEKYWVAIFGTPGDHHGWGIRFEGHHLSINVTLLEDRISVTPSFMGANPAEVREGEHQGLRPLAEEEDLARVLVTTLLEADHDDVLFSEDPPEEILTGQDRVAKAPEPVGITAEAMTESQRTALMELISVYTGRYRAEIAKEDMKKITDAGVENIRFGWAGGTEPGDAYYYRIQGPTFIMEAANVQNDANHIHAVWRDFDGDFGRDILKEHMESHDH